ncbi:DUF262 domain-containing protein [Delftia sp. DLF01]|uniref:GmrSD restriction endonuclease domain-containing protein n=1 Tax=Delftia sp. DLF01 TaxID=2769279 RepID=UPI0017838B11|nr:DUF262 domain-containing protein [Delftia sp. DLF01]MBD9584489.1 DUF262 domain-containing protein [Delftia sp. DLF01]
MQADALQLMKLYDTLNKAYVIPLYQRPFAWEPRKAIELLDAVLEDAQQGARLTSLGTLLFCDIPDVKPFGNSTPTTIGPNTLWEVVDGQQRLTVFGVIGHALKIHHDTLATAGLVYAPSLELEMLYETSRGKKGKTVPVLIRDGDNYDTGFASDLAKMLDSFAGHSPWPAGVGQRLVDTHKSVVEWVNENLDATNFATFCEHFLIKCTIVQVLADDQNTAFTMFEPLNSTSEPLTAFEVYRSKAVRQLAAQFPKTELLLAYEETKRDEVITRSNNLIFNMAQTYSGLRPRIHFVPLKHYLDEHVDALFIAKFEEAADFFRTIWLEQTSTAVWFDDEAKNCVRFLKAMSHDIAIPLLLRYYLERPTELPKVLKIIVAFYALWRAAFPTNALPKTYRALLTEKGPDDLSVIGGKPLKTVQDLAVYFKSRLSDKIGLLSPGQTQEHKWSVEVTLNYEELKTLCRLFIFLEMGATIKSNLVPNDPWTSVDDVEHIHAVGLTPTPPSVHKIGNLTFLPSTINKSLQAASWSDKREVYAWLAAPGKAVVPVAYAGSGKTVPKAIKDYLNDVNSPSLAHLGPIAGNAAWGESEIGTRSAQILSRVWNVLHVSWLHP